MGNFGWAFALKSALNFQVEGGLDNTLHLLAFPLRAFVLKCSGLLGEFIKGFGFVSYIVCNKIAIKS